MSALEAFSFALAAVFVVLGGWTVVRWWKARTRATALLAGAFVGLAAAIVISRLHTLTAWEVPWPGVVLYALNVVLAVFPWLVAASVWAIVGTRPRWSWIGIVGVPLVCLWLWFAPLSGDPMALVEQVALLALFGLLWVIAAVGTAIRLRRAARSSGLAKPRMRLMATGVLVLASALVIDLLTMTADATIGLVVMNAVAVVAALLFLLGFLAPRTVRAWWRRSAVGAFQRMQAELLAAMTREDVARAVVGPLAEVLGSGVLVADLTGEVLAQAGVDEETAEDTARRLAAGESLPVGLHAHSVREGWLVAVAAPFTPLFDQDERDLITAYATQIRISLERARLFESVTAQQRDLEEMLLGLAHDIRSPTAAIVGTAELIEEADDPDFRAELRQILQDSTGYLRRLVDAMLELGHVRSGVGQHAPVALLAVARSVGGRVQAASPGVEVSCGGEAATVSMDPTRAEQVFDNLLGNAVKHGGREDLRIEVAVHDRGDHVEVVVADDGVGIPPQDHRRIFTPFQRGSSAQGAGSGIGLGLVHRVVRDLGGTIELAPSTHGARFVLRLPVQETADAPV